MPHLAGMDADMDCGSVGLLSLHTLDVDDILLPVDLHHLADLLPFIVSTDNLGAKASLAQQHCDQTSSSRPELFIYRNHITCTSSSLRIGMDLTLYFWRSSLDSGEDMIFLLMCEGALKCLLRFLRREDVTNWLSFMMLWGETNRLYCETVKLTFP